MDLNVCEMEFFLHNLESCKRLTNCENVEITRFFKPRNAPEPHYPGASLWTPVRELTALPQSPDPFLFCFLLSVF